MAVTKQFIGKCKIISENASTEHKKPKESAFFELSRLYQEQHINAHVDGDFDTITEILKWPIVRAFCLTEALLSQKSIL